MKPILITVQVGVVVSVFVFSYFLGAPVYWEIVSRVNSYSSSAVPSSKGNYKHNHTDNYAQKPKDSYKEGFSSADFDTFLQKPIWERPPPHSTMPPPEVFALTKQMVASRAKKKVIVVTFANHAFLDFVLTWVKHLTDLNVFNLLVGAMDTKILEALFWEGVPVFDMGSNVNTIDVGWGTPTFHKMGREKVILVDHVLSMGFEILMCDTDMVWMKNPLPYFARFPRADVLVSSDQVASSVDDDQLEVWEQDFYAAHGAYNIGIFLWRPSNIAKQFAKEWKEQLLADDNIWDQNGFNDLMRKRRGPSVEGENGIFYSYNGSLKLGVLPVSIFCSGHTYFVQALYKKLGLKPYAVHTTFQFGGTPGKRHRLREAKLFYDKPDYYNVSGGILSYRSSIPQDLLTSGPNSIENHFNLVNYQIRQIRDALAIASILNRTLVMPEMWCRLDRLWFGHPGVLPGTRTDQPFLCPLDHVFEVNRMLEILDVHAFGPTIHFREYSFLNNPRLPQEMKQSRIKVKLCKKGSEGCGEEIEGKLRLPRNSTDLEIFTTLSNYKDVKILEFSSMNASFHGFEDKEREAKFRARVKRYTGIWCCAENLQRGHIYYDIYWDEKPDWKPVPPATQQDDHPPF
ncbi:hypothetical protein GOP47_0003005 [Adiantum capillus-veneris]|uniref:Nucleotide-diphospho-sugar transferase domain-containing protein n=1 Tax=Adiantum capillus-veneris TaxID=13818 RepID=A0A9D4VD53_ADICA|nr:hypothetical protein GOP47_0003005 [Adiantum capillus-veneris]